MDLLDSKVLIQKRSVKLRDILPIKDDADLQALLSSHPNFLAKLKSPSTPPPSLLGLSTTDLSVPSYYTPRKFVSMRRVITPDIFTHESDDVFFVTGKSVSSLQEHFKSQELITIDSYENQIQLEKITVKLVACDGINFNDDKSSFDVIRKLTTSPVHWLQCDASLNFDWITTSGSKRLVEHYRDLRTDVEALSSEENIIPHKSCTTHVSLRSMTRGTGMSTLVHSIGKRLSEQFPSRYILHLKMSDFLELIPNFMDELENGSSSSDESDNPEGSGKDRAHIGLDEFLENKKVLGFGESVSEDDEEYQVAKKVLKLMMLNQSVSSGPNVELLLTNWEVLGYTQVTPALELVKDICRIWKGCRVWSFSIEALQPLSFYRALEESFDGRMKTFGLMLLSHEDQLAIARNVFKGDETYLKVFRSALKDFTSLVDEDPYSFTNSPGYLLEFIDIIKALVQGEEELFKNVEEDKLGEVLPLRIIIFAKLCEKILETKAREYYFDNIYRGEFFNGREATVRKFMEAHEYFAMQKYIPGSVPMLKTIMPDVKNMETMDLARFGVITGWTTGRGGHDAIFSDLPIAEYLCWKIITENGLGLESSGDMIDADNIGEGQQTVGNFSEMLTDAVKQKGLLRLGVLNGIKRAWKVGSVGIAKVEGRERVGLNCFKMEWEFLDKYCFEGKVSGVRGASVKGGISVLPDIPSEGKIFGECVKGGHSDIVKYLIQKKGFGPRALEKHGGLWKFMEMALSNKGNDLGKEVVRGRKEILKLFKLAEKDLVVEEITNRFKPEELSWGPLFAFKLYEVEMIDFLDKEICDGAGGLLGRVDKAGNTIFHVMAACERSYREVSVSTKNLMKRNVVDWKIINANGKTAIDVAFDMGNFGVAVGIADGLVEIGDNQGRDDAKEIYKFCLEKMSEEEQKVDVRTKLKSLEEKEKEMSKKVGSEKSSKSSANYQAKVQKKEMVDSDKGVIKDKKKKRRWYRILC